MGTRIVLAALLALLAVLPARAEESGWVAWDGRRPGEHGDRTKKGRIAWVGQVVDRETGAPIFGCRVRVYSEVGRVILDGDATLVSEGTSDEDGFLLLEVGRALSVSKWIYEAEGYAPQTETVHDWTRARDEAVVALSREPHYRGRVVDPLGRPCPGVRVSTFQGCSHTPALRRAVTDDTGRFTLPNVYARRLWTEGPGIASAYGDCLIGPDGEALVLARPGITATGRLTNPEGIPLPGIWVRGPWHRGPGVRTDAKGRFRLPGLEAGGEIRLSTDTWPEDNGVITSVFAAYVVPDPRTFRLVFDTAELVVPRGPDAPWVTLELPGGAGQNRVTLIHRETGHAYVAEFEGDEGEMEVPAGPYEVRIGGPFCSQWYVRFEDEFRTSCPLLKPKPYLTHDRVTLRIEFEGDDQADPEWMEWMSMVLTEPGGEQIAVVEGEDILVPPDTPLAVFIRGDDLPPTFYPIERIPADVPETVVRKIPRPAPTRLSFFLPEGTFREELTVRFLGADYEELSTATPELDGNGNWVVTYRSTAARHLVIEHAAAGSFATVEFMESPEPGAVHHLGDLRLEPVREVRAMIRDDRGRPLGGLWVVFRGGMQGLYPGLDVADEGEGVYNHPRIFEARGLRIAGPGRFPVTWPAEGWGPFEVTLSSASVTVELPEGDAARAWGYLDGREMHLDAEARTLSLSGIPPGKHRLKIHLPDGRHLKRIVEVRKAQQLRLGF